MKGKIFVSMILITALLILSSVLIREEIKTPREPSLKGFGWYGYSADDEINEASLGKIKELCGNSININVYYEYDADSKTFLLKSNLTKIEEKIDMAHNNNLTVLLSTFSNLVGGNYMANAIGDDFDVYMDGARNISLELAKFSQDNHVEIYAIWNEMGLSLTKVPNSTKVVNQWLQSTREDVSSVYNGVIVTKEGLQLGLYRAYNFSGFDYIGVTFYPFTTSTYIDPYTGMQFTGVENLEEYRKLVKTEYNNLIHLKKKYGNVGIILDEIGIDVVNKHFIGDDDESREIRSMTYEIVLREGKEIIDGFYFSKFERENGGSEGLDQIFKNYFCS